MLKLFKYEMKNTFRFFLSLCVAIFFANIFLYLVTRQAISYQRVIHENILVVLSLIFVFILLGCTLTFFFMVVSSYRRDFYQDSAYLTHTLPLTGSQFLGAKVLNTAIWYLVLIVILIVANIIGSSYAFGWKEVSELMRQVFIDEFRDPYAVILGTVMSLIKLFYGILVLFFSITLAKWWFHNSKGRYIWFVMLLIIDLGISYIDSLIVRVFPLFQTFTGEGVINISHLEYTDLLLFEWARPQFAIVSLIFYFMINILLFAGTAYLIEKRIDL